MSYGFSSGRGSTRHAEPAEYRTGKQVYPTRQIAHIWAHGLQDGAQIRCPASMSARGFKGRADIYSYSTIMARRLDSTRGSNGQPVYLINPHSYSVTTSKHQSLINQAIPGGAIEIRIQPATEYRSGTRRGGDTSLWEALAEGKAGPVIALFRERADVLAKEATAPRIRPATRQAKLDAIASLAIEFARLRNFFGLRCKPDALKLPTSPSLEEAKAIATKHAASIERQHKRERAAAAKREAERAAQAAADDKALQPIVAAWRRGEVDDLSSGSRYSKEYRHLSYPALRLVPAKSAFAGGDAREMVETSLGAVVSVKDARQVLRILPRLIANLNQRDDAAMVGHFRGMGATSQALVIGCHSIPWHEVRAFCAHVGWSLPETVPPLPGMASDGKPVA